MTIDVCLDRRSEPRPWPGPSPTVRDLHGLPAVLARAGPLELRLATTDREIRKAQRLRYRVFFEDGGAVAEAADAAARRDRCPFDETSDHLLVIDTARLDARGRLKPKTIGTYRLMRSDMAARGPGFYTAGEFDIAGLLSRHAGRRFLELGRSCVHPAYRSKRVIGLLWRGIGIYAAHHGSDVLIGCASLAGVDVQAHALPLSFAYHHAAADPDWSVSPRPGRGVRMDRLPIEAVDPRAAIAALPPLVKAYIRVGSRFGAEAVIDHRFGTTDLFTVLPLASADPRYLAQFGAALGPLT